MPVYSRGFTMRKPVISDDIFLKRLAFNASGSGTAKRVHISSLVRNDACLKDPGQCLYT